MQKKVTTIPATIKKFSQTSINQVNKIKVAAYARVSTDHEDQVSSYEAQIDYYENYIKGRSDWEFAGMYSDEGISGTNTKKRIGFQSMVNDALEGKIDLIITKSVSRFARNTVDSLTTVRKLKEKGVEIYFEKENIWTLDSKGELLITIMSSLAQEESRSISENCTWGQRKRFADGKVSVPYKTFLGYDKGKDGNLAINKEEAKIVKKIYSLFLQGYNIGSIASILTSEGIRTPRGKEQWYHGTVKSILSNEKYKGDALLQKTFTVDYLTKKAKKNEGEVEQYYIKDNHEAIIPRETFERVQRLLKKKSEDKYKHSSVSIFSSRIKCGSCGANYGSKLWHSNSKYRKTIWQCNEKFKNEVKCETPHICEEEIKEIFIKAINEVIKKKKTIQDEGIYFIKSVLNTEELESEKENLEEKINTIVKNINLCIADNSKKVQDQKRYEESYNKLVFEYERLQSELCKIKEEILDKQIRKDEIQYFLKNIEEQVPIAEFDDTLWCNTIECIIVNIDNNCIVKFQDGTEIKVNR